MLDEVQKIPRWSEMVKRLTDEDRRGALPLRVVLLGSSALLMQRGLSESLAGRFELHRHPHWSFRECHDICPLERFSGSRVRQRGSTPKLLVLDNALVTALSGMNFIAAKRDGAFWGRLVENAVGAQLYWDTHEQGGELFYWRDRHDEVDFVSVQGRRVSAVEVKTGTPNALQGLRTFERRFPGSQTLVLSRHTLPRFFAASDVGAPKS